MTLALSCCKGGSGGVWKPGNQEAWFWIQAGFEACGMLGQVTSLIGENSGPYEGGSRPLPHCPGRWGVFW